VIHRLIFWLSGFLPIRFISVVPGTPYVERYYLGRLVGRYWYLQRFVQADPYESTHDHPYLSAWSLILSGWYREVLATIDPRAFGGCRTRTIHRGPLSFARFGRERWHRIEACAPDTWSLWCHTEWIACGWGFLDVEDDVICEDGQERFEARAIYRPFIDNRPTKRWWHYVPRGRDVERHPLQTRSA